MKDFWIEVLVFLWVLIVGMGLAFILGYELGNNHAIGTHSCAARPGFIMPEK